MLWRARLMELRLLDDAQRRTNREGVQPHAINCNRAPRDRGRSVTLCPLRHAARGSGCAEFPTSLKAARDLGRSLRRFSLTRAPPLDRGLLGDQNARTDPHLARPFAGLPHIVVRRAANVPVCCTELIYRIRCRGYSYLLVHRHRYSVLRVYSRYAINNEILSCFNGRGGLLTPLLHGGRRRVPS